MPDTLRDDAILEAIRARLTATGAFDAVFPVKPDPAKVPTGLRVRSLAWVYWTGATEEPDSAIGAGGPTYERAAEYQLAIEARADADTARLQRFARLDSAARNAILLRDEEQPWRSIELGRAQEVKAVVPPAMRALVPVTARYTIDGATVRDVTDREGM